MSEVIDRLIVADTGAGHSSQEATEAKRVVSTVYNMLATSWDLVQMWNWGYDDPKLHQEIEEIIPGYNRFGSDGLCEQLYYYTLRQVPRKLSDYRGKRVLEVGSGIGGGLNFLSRVLDGAELRGVDLSKTAVARANARHARGKTLSYTVGDAEDIPFDDGSFDVVINLESCHNYPHLDRFLAEVARVLKPGGHFSMVDLFNDLHTVNFNQAKSTNTQLEWLSETDISPQVSKAVRQRMAPGSHLRETFAKQKAPLLHRIIGEPCWTAAFGALFTGDASTSAVAKFARKIGGLSSLDKAPIRSYRHYLATRVS
ncbi:class I SAM-dependent methyltransferase [Goodfellowiella coeruleoviolacea]|uniref:Methyltransferase domain-containing protein n=1 Tax=Goodfellowiella coeruleoviolacea TaxID=334858 RepID=A0AAE3GHE4_9PSEU|nr:class I SAM-dependent methyltransferase [Goodfellowiella coeruleoviolacea]MCP2167415.1 Methyltransferase domain-containing protein [Goodfellowiella coeruleoviolacea]